MNVTAAVRQGDGHRDYATVQAGDMTVHIYESLIEPGRIVIDVEGEPERLAIAINDAYVHGGPQ